MYHYQPIFTKLISIYTKIIRIFSLKREASFAKDRTKISLTNTERRDENAGRGGAHAKWSVARANRDRTHDDNGGYEHENEDRRGWKEESTKGGVKTSYDGGERRVGEGGARDTRYSEGEMNSYLRKLHAYAEL